MTMLNRKILECVPNFSEGRNKEIINAIAESIRSVEGVQLLDVDPGEATNRTVMTFVGEPEKVVEAAFQAIKTAAELIDMRKHKGAHPRMGATDVCPLVPVANMTMEEASEWAHQLAKRVGEELRIPVYMYEFSATKPERKSLASIRQGEYEALPEKLKLPEWKPDYGPAEWNDHVAKTGATAIGARPFLVAYNVNLNTTNVRRANSVAFDIRERGRLLRKGHPVIGEKVMDADGKPVYMPGLLKGVRAIGWYIDEYGIAQVSMNITNIDEVPIHVAFETTDESARKRGLRVTGSEIVGLVPLKVLLEAGKYYLKRQRRSWGVPEEEIVHIAIESLGLNSVQPFDPEKKIIEYRIQEDDRKNSLVRKTVREFVNEVSVDSPVPGGGSVGALVGSLAAALASMVANLSAHKHGWEDKFEYFATIAEKAQNLKDRLLYLVDADSKSFQKVMDAFKVKASVEEKQKKIQEAYKEAMEIPFQTLQTVRDVFPLLEELAQKGLQASITDVASGASCGRAAAEAAYMNVLINAREIEDKEWVEERLSSAKKLLEDIRQAHEELFKSIETKLQ